MTTFSGEKDGRIYPPRPQLERYIAVYGWEDVRYSYDDLLNPDTILPG